MRRQEAERLKVLAETKYKNSNLKSALKHVKKAHRLCPSLEGISSMLSAFKILRAASKAGGAREWYEILQVEPFSHINSIKKQYRKLALNLHPDKNPYLGCEEAFKLVGEGFRVFSDRIRRQEYDMKLRIRIQEERVDDGLEGNGVAGDTFWTACSRCRLLHKFERKYLGYNLVCPSCKKSFLAVEVDGESGGDESTEEEKVVVATVRVSERLTRKIGSKTDGFESVGLEGKKDSDETVRSVGLRRKVSVEHLKEKEGAGDVNAAKAADDGKLLVGRLRSGGLKRKTSTVGDVLARSVAGKVGDEEMEDSSKSKSVKVAEETMTLAELQLEIKRKANQGKAKLNLKQKVKDTAEKEKERDREASKK